MPESFPKEKRQVERSHSKLKYISILFKGIKIFFWPRMGYSIWKLWFVLLSAFIVVFAESGEFAITVLFLLHKPLQWNRALIGIYAIVRSFSHALALFLLLPLLSRILKLSETFIVLIGIIFTVGSNVWLGFVKSTWEMFVGKL